MHAARVTVVLCVCMYVCVSVYVCMYVSVCMYMYVCMYICMYVCPLISAASHIGITKERYQQIHRNTGIVFNFADFLKNASFKSYGIICLPRVGSAS